MCESEQKTDAIKQANKVNWDIVAMYVIHIHKGLTLSKILNNKQLIYCTVAFHMNGDCMLMFFI